MRAVTLIECDNIRHIVSLQAQSSIAPICKTRGDHCFVAISYSLCTAVARARVCVCVCVCVLPLLSGSSDRRSTGRRRLVTVEQVAVEPVACGFVSIRCIGASLRVSELRSISLHVSARVKTDEITCCLYACPSVIMPHAPFEI